MLFSKLDCAMAEGHVKDLLEKEVTCSLCSNLFKKPKKLVCGHVFCKECLKALVKPGGLNATITCPDCHTVTEVPNNDISNFPTASFMKSLVKALQQDQGESSMNPADHCKSLKYCPLHPTNSFQFYCETCKKFTVP